MHDGPSEVKKPPSPQADASVEPVVRLSHRRRKAVLTSVMLGLFLSALDQTVISVALRTITDDLHGLSQQAWVTTAYLVTGTVVGPMYGKLADIFGRRRTYATAIALFAVGSLLCAAAGSVTELAVFRAVQGMGGGGLASLAMTVIADVTTLRERGRYQGFYTAVFGTAALAGPVVGGVLAGQDALLGVAGWRWIFLINLPLAALALVMVLRLLRVPHRPVRHRLDVLGAVALVAAAAPLLVAAEQGGAWGWGSRTAWSLYGAGVLGLAVFVAVERRAGDAALLPLRLFRAHVFRLGVTLHFMVGFGVFGAAVTLPLYLQLVQGMTPVEAGLASLPTAAASLVTTLVVGRIIARTGRIKPCLVAGVACLALGLLVCAGLGLGSSMLVVTAGMVLLGAGMGAAMQTMTTLAQSGTPRSDMGAATAAVNFFRTSGGTVGTALFLSVVFSSTASHVHERISAASRNAPFRALAEQPGNARVITSLLGPGGNGEPRDSSALARLDAVLSRPFREAYADALHAAFLLGAVVMLAALVHAIARVPDSTLPDA
nr:MDR family MFS transporter [Streptomyces antibioticus]